MLTEQENPVVPQVARLLEQIKLIDRQYGEYIAMSNPRLAELLSQTALTLGQIYADQTAIMHNAAA